MADVVWKLFHGNWSQNNIQQSVVWYESRCEGDFRFLARNPLKQQVNALFSSSLGVSGHAWKWLWPVRLKDSLKTNILKTN